MPNTDYDPKHYMPCSGGCGSIVQTAIGECDNCAPASPCNQCGAPCHWSTLAQYGGRCTDCGAW